jgi:hypothetical protein
MVVFIAEQVVSDHITVKKEEVLKVTKKQVKFANCTISKSDIDVRPAGRYCVGTTPEKALEILVNKNKAELKKAKKLVLYLEERLDNSLAYCIDESDADLSSREED